MSAQLSIQRLNATYLVPRALPDASAARSRLDGTMRRHLASTCSRFLDQVLDENDPSVWVIRKLDLSLALDVGVVDEDLLTRTWASRIVASLARTITRGPDGESVMRFPDRAAYLAHFLRDMSEGSAWEDWQYDSLDSLRSLPPSAAMREALLREPEQTENVLLHLARRGWLDQVLSFMTERDVLRVYEACVNEHAAFFSEDDERRTTKALLAIWHGAPVRAIQSRIAHAQNMLRLYVALRLKSPDFVNFGSLSTTITHLLGFAEILRRIDKPEALLSFLVKGRLREAAELAMAGGATSHLESLAFVNRVAGGDKDSLGELVQILSGNVSAVLAKEKKDSPRIVASECGGLFLLVPAMLDLNLHRLIESAPYSDSDEWNKEQLLRYLLFLKLGAVDAAYDFVPRFLAGFDELPSFDDLRDFSRAATAEMNQACLWLLLEELVRRGRVDGINLAAELIGDGDDRVLLLRDIATDFWVYAVRCGDETATIRESLERGLQMARQVTGNSPGCLFLEKDLEVCLGAETVDPPQHIKELLSRRRSAAKELAYFSLLDRTPAIDIDADFDLVWSLVARAVMKEFAFRLMNFGWSSAEYVAQNFLEGNSTLIVEAGRVDVRLARPPLQIMLRIAGLDEQSYTVPWLNDTQVTLSLMPE